MIRTYAVESLLPLFPLEEVLLSCCTALSIAKSEIVSDGGSVSFPREPDLDVRGELEGVILDR